MLISQYSDKEGPQQHLERTASVSQDRSRAKRIVIDHFTVVGKVTWPLTGSEAGVDLVLIQTSLLLLCKSSCSHAN